MESSGPNDPALISRPESIQQIKSSNPSTYLLPKSEDLEALKVVQVLPSLGALGLQGEVALGPLAIDLVLLPQLSDGASTGGTGQLGDDEVGEGGVGEREDVTGHDLVLLGGRTVNQDLSMRLVNIWRIPAFSHLPDLRIVPPPPDSKSSEFRGTYTLVVDNLDDGGQLAGVGTATDQDHAANLNELPLSNLDIDIGHGEGFLDGDEKRRLSKHRSGGQDGQGDSKLTVDKLREVGGN